MKRPAVRYLALVLAIAAGSVSAQDYYDESRDYRDDAIAQDAGAYEAAYAYQDGHGPAYPQQGYPQQGYPQQGPAYSQRDQAEADDGGVYDVARVLSVDPIVEQAQPVARQECWNEPSQVYVRNVQPVPRRTSGAGAVIGAIIGGALGSTVSNHGHGRYGYGHGYRHHGGHDEAAIVAGAVIGGVVGNGIERQNQYRAGAYGTQQTGYYAQRPVQRCRVVNAGSGEQHVSGYRVSYEYGGRQYQTVTDYHPGNEIRVRIEVTAESQR